MVGSTRLLRRHRKYRPLLRLPQHAAAELLGLRGREAAVGGETSDVRTVAARQQMQVAFDVDDAELVADQLRPADAPLRQRILLPHRRAVAAVERLHAALVVDDVEAA